MTLRTESRVEHLWVCVLLAMAAIIVYVIAVTTWEDGCDMALILRPDRMRYFLPISVVFGLLMFETRWDGVVRERKQPHRQRSRVNGKPDGTADAPARAEATGDAPPEMSVASGARQDDADAATVPEAGEAEFLQARRIPHGELPDYVEDCDYLALLGQSAALGYPRALVKLGEYAMWRETWVEAYYWTWRARQAGMLNLDQTLRGIRQAWVMCGYPTEISNVHGLFTEEAGNVGRALLNMDAGRCAATARAFLREKHPELFTP